MKKIVTLLLVLCLALGLCACGSTGSTGSTDGAGSGDKTDNAASGGVFMAGFGMEDITPMESVPLDSYGDARDRMSTGMFSFLEARAVAIKDAEGTLMVFAVGDVSWCPASLGNVIRADMSAELGIPETHIVLSGTHTHSSVAVGLTDIPSVGNFNEKYINGMEKAIREAVEDLKPSKLYAGTTTAENLCFVRRYIMDDGSLVGDNAYGTGTVIDHHETEADNELRLLKFVREGGKDILIGNYQGHPHLEGKTTNVSAQVVGAYRDAVEADIGAHCLYWQGASGNLNTSSRIGSEMRTKDRKEWGQLLCNHTKEVYDTLEEVQTGPIKVATTVFTGRVNHGYDHLVSAATEVVNYFNSGHTAGEAAEFAWQFGINSYYHANRIISNSNRSNTCEINLITFSFGDIGAIVMPYEMFDQSGMQVREQSPFKVTFMVGYSYPGGFGYIPTEQGYENGGYESDNSIFAPGTGEELVTAYVGLLKQMHGGE